MSDNLDLARLVREVCADSMTADPSALTKEVAARIKKIDRDAALEQALFAFVRQTISRHRFSFSNHSQCDSSAMPTVGRSRKVAGIRQAWHNMLHARLSVGREATEWKFLADCTVIDLEYAAAIRDKQAEQNVANAVWLRQLAGLIIDYGVSKVNEIPESALASVLNAAT